jgi:branched-chain amino acid transport system ATP-binding protein
MLQIRGLHSGYGRIEALHGIDLDVPEGQIVSLIGANGAGKTTLLMTICGNPQATSGEIIFDGRPITHMPTHEIARIGIAHSPEGRRIFARMSVFENLQTGAIVADPKFFNEDLERVLALFPRLKERLEQRGGTLSGGEQQMLAIARALMSRPRLLLLDEPSLGLAPLITKQLFANIAEINRADGMTILLVEQNAFQALKLASYAHIIVNGQIELSGTGADLLKDPAVRAAYLEGGAVTPEVAPEVAP